MKLLLVSEYFPPHWTGISKAFYSLAKNLQSQGYDIVVLTTKFNQKIKRTEEIDGIKIIRSPFAFRLSRTHYSYQILFAFIKMVRSFDGVIINSPNSNILFFSLITKLFNKRLAIYHQGDIVLPKQTGCRICNFILERIFDLCSLPSFILADVVSTYTKDYARNSRVMKYSLHKFTAFIPQFRKVEKKPSKKIQNTFTNLRKKGYIVGFAGRFVEEKAYDILLKAIKPVIKSAGPCTFVFAGKTDIDYEPFFGKLKTLIEENKLNIEFLGLLDDADLLYFYKNIDVFVVSSRSDCFPVTQIEASVVKTPIVVTDIPGARMFVKETGFGEIVQPENPDSLADGLIKVLTNKSVYINRFKNVTSYYKKYERFKFGA